MKEGQFNSKLLHSIKREGMFCYKTADRFHGGVPDIYIPSGIWIESKVIKVGAQDRIINLSDRVTPNQHNFAKDLLNAGDRVIFCGRIEGPVYKHLMMVSYYHLQQKVWRTVDLLEFPKILVEAQYDVSSYLGGQYPRNVNPNWYIEKE